MWHGLRTLKCTSSLPLECLQGICRLASQLEDKKNKIRVISDERGRRGRNRENREKEIMDLSFLYYSISLQ